MIGMTKAQAEFWQKTITELLADKKLITVVTRPNGKMPDIRVSESFESTYLVDYKDDSYVVGINDSYGIVSSREWHIDPNHRAIHATEENGLGEKLWFSWVIAEESRIDDLWRRMTELQRESWRVK